MEEYQEYNNYESAPVYVSRTYENITENVTLFRDSGGEKENAKVLILKRCLAHTFMIDK